MITECIMREHEILFEDQNGFMKQTPLAFKDRNVLSNQAPLTIKPNKQQEKPRQESTTSNTQEHTATHHISTQKPENQQKKSKIEEIIEKNDSYENMRQQDTEGITDFIKRFEDTYLNLEKEGTPLPPHLLALDLLRKSNLNEREVRAALASCDTEKTGGPYLQALTLLRQSKLEEEPKDTNSSPATTDNSTEENGQEFYMGIRSYLRFMDAL